MKDHQRCRTLWQRAIFNGPYCFVMIPALHRENFELARFSAEVCGLERRIPGWFICTADGGVSFSLLLPGYLRSYFCSVSGTTLGGTM